MLHEHTHTNHIIYNNKIIYYIRVGGCAIVACPYKHHVLYGHGPRTRVESWACHQTRLSATSSEPTPPPPPQPLELNNHLNEQNIKPQRSPVRPCRRSALTPLIEMLFSSLKCYWKWFDRVMVNWSIFQPHVVIFDRFDSKSSSGRR